VCAVTCDPSVLLDMTHLDPAFVVERFPAIHGRCLQLGIVGAVVELLRLDLDHRVHFL
jgi:aspartate oxidase